MESIVLYSTHCPKCQVLEKKLNKTGLKYIVCDDIAVMREKGFIEAPMLQVNETVFDFTNAVKWINQR